MFFQCLLVLVHLLLDLIKDLFSLEICDNSNSNRTTFCLGEFCRLWVRFVQNNLLCNTVWVWLQSFLCMLVIYMAQNYCLVYCSFWLHIVKLVLLMSYIHSQVHYHVLIDEVFTRPQNTDWLVLFGFFCFLNGQSVSGSTYFSLTCQMLCHNPHSICEAFCVPHQEIEQ